eukprot:5966007-Karenia_brevis.AAC.1
MLLMGSKGLKCEISKKTAIVGSREKLVELQRRHLIKIGLKAKTPTVTRDLGLDYTCGNKRSFGMIKKGYRGQGSDQKEWGSFTQSTKGLKP